jgi:hypothetical protein
MLHTRPVWNHMGLRVAPSISTSREFSYSGIDGNGTTHSQRVLTLELDGQQTGLMMLVQVEQQHHLQGACPADAFVTAGHAQTLGFLDKQSSSLFSSFAVAFRAADGKPP